LEKEALFKEETPLIGLGWKSAFPRAPKGGPWVTNPLDRRRIPPHPFGENFS